MLTMIQSLDDTLLLWIQEHLRMSFLSIPMVFFSTLGNAGVFWIVLSIVLITLPRTRKYGMLALTSLFICFLFNNILLKNLVARPRPYKHLSELVMLMQAPSDYSFPSGHACSSFATSGALLWSMKKTWNRVRISCILLAALISFSRLYVGVHYPTDVLVGALIGLVGSYLICCFFTDPYERLTIRLNYFFSRKK